MAGALARRAVHQDAPKVSHTGRPLSPDREIGSPPLTVRAAKSCAGLPTSGAGPEVSPVTWTAWAPFMAVLVAAPA